MNTVSAFCFDPFFISPKHYFMSNVLVTHSIVIVVESRKEVTDEHLYHRIPRSSVIL